MQKNTKFSIKKRVKSFKYAFNGFWLLIHNEHNSRIHLFFAVLAVTGGFYFNISTTEWLVLLLTFSTVFVAEFFNSSIEALADKITEEKHPHIKKAKDTAAGGVLFAAIISVIVGIIIFGPRLLEII